MSGSAEWTGTDMHGAQMMYAHDGDPLNTPIRFTFVVCDKSVD